MCVFIYVYTRIHMQSEIYAWVDKALAHLPVLFQNQDSRVDSEAIQPMHVCVSVVCTSPRLD